MARHWTDDQKKRQAEKIIRWRPWERSTGPKSAAGKSIAARNAYKGGTRDLQRTLSRKINSILKDQSDCIDDLLGSAGTVSEPTCTT